MSPDSSHLPLFLALGVFLPTPGSDRPKPLVAEPVTEAPVPEIVAIQQEGAKVDGSGRYPHRAGKASEYVASLVEVWRLPSEFPLEWIEPAAP